MPVTQQHQRLNNLPNARSEVSAKLKLSQLSTVFNIAKEKLLLDLTDCKNENCGENGCSVLVVDTSSIAAGMSYQLATLARI